MIEVDFNWTLIRITPDNFPKEADFILVNFHNAKNDYRKKFILMIKYLR